MSGSKTDRKADSLPPIVGLSIMALAVLSFIVVLWIVMAVVRAVMG